MDFKSSINCNNSFVKVETNKNGQVIICNENTSQIELLLGESILATDNFLKVVFEGKILNGTYVQILLDKIDRSEQYPVTINSESYIESTKNSKYLFRLIIQPKTKLIIDKIELSFVSDIESYYKSIVVNDLLIISPSYPSIENKYFSGFVHSRTKAYTENNLKFTMICAFNYNSYSKYVYEDVCIYKMPFHGLREVLTRYRFKKIGLHFFDENYANILQASYLNDTELLLWIHGPETLYWDWPKFTSPYFEKNKELTPDQILGFKKKDTLISKFNGMENVKWIFVSKWIKERSEELLSIKFNRFEIIHNYINDKLFSPTKSESNFNDKTKIFILRRYDDTNKYAVDISVRSILELSKRKIFKKLEFNIYGSGDAYEKLLQPIKKFKNINFYPYFLAHDQIALAHKNNDIALFPTRYDAQGVSMCEAASSGLGIISSSLMPIKEFIPDIGNLIPSEDYIKYADYIEKLALHPESIRKLSRSCSEKINNTCSFKKTIKKEFQLFNSEKQIIQKDSTNYLTSPIESRPILTVIVPAYNISLYISKCVESLVNHPYGNLIEVIIINDGSTDDTKKVAANIAKYWNKNGLTIIRIINKVNGGHGSTINLGIQEAKGKFFKVVDGDDWVDTQNFAKLIQKLQNESADLIVHNYSEDFSKTNQLLKREIYNFLTPEIAYFFDDLCHGDSYGFGIWGPILATSAFKTSLLKDTNFSLMEKTPYVDMEFNAYAIENVKTIKYYDLDIYRYFIGREGQSISYNSYIKNYKKHETIIFNIIEYITKKNLSNYKRNYIIDKIIIPMTLSQYIILYDYIKSIEKASFFNSKLALYPEIFNNQKLIKARTNYDNHSKESITNKIYLFSKYFKHLVKKLINI